MKCPKCHSAVRPSKKYPGYYLCDHCKKRFPEASLLPDDEPVTDKAAKQKTQETTDISIDDTSALDKLLDIDVETDTASPKKKKKLPWLIVLIIMIVLFCCGFLIWQLFLAPKSTDKSVPDADSEPATKTVFQVGEEADINNLNMQVVNYEESTGDDWTTPAEGTVFVFIQMEVTNNTAEDITINNLSNFSFLCDGNEVEHSADAYTALSTNSDKITLDGTIVSGGILKGYLCLAVPTEWKNITVEFTDPVWSENGIKFEINK